ncbi:MAG: hypothetical protein COB29_07610 [Sulfitobacter sp.]|nr:hypothetical protein [Roseobacter sp.]PHR08283.1 MAG: hypothetical protein COB29_07610 [Sulfitobacter sp.]
MAEALNSISPCAASVSCEVQRWGHLCADRPSPGYGRDLSLRAGDEPSLLFAGAAGHRSGSGGKVRDADRLHHGKVFERLVQTCESFTHDPLATRDLK